MSPRLFALGLVLAGCGGGGPPPITTDAGCGAPGVPADQPSIGCPAEVDLGCVGPAGAAIGYAVSTAACDGTVPSVVCDPASGATVLPPTAGGPGFATCTATAASGASASCSFPIRMRVMGPPALACAPPVTVACSGPRTPVSVPPAAALSSCDGTGELPPPTSDAPAEGFAVGTSRITFTAAGPAGPVTCSTPVVVTDDVPPSITCPVGPQTLVRSAPSDVILNFRPPATDGCDAAPDVTVAPMPTGRGDTPVVATAIDDAGNTSTCNAVIRVLDVFAPTALRVLSAELSADGSTDVTLGWEPTRGLDVEELRIERAASRGGPFTELMRVPPATLTFTDAAMPGERAYYRIIAFGPSGTRGGQTDVVEAFAVARDGYDVGGAAVPGVPFATSLYGVVRHPLDLSAGPYPLVVFLHGNHGNCRPPSGDDACETRTAHACEDPRFGTTPNAEGYVYLMETLAAQGYVAVSLSANALNCRDDFIRERTALIVEHLRRWTARTLPLPSALLAAVDPARTALFGHSRGGEAVSQVPEALRDGPIAGLSLASVFAVGATDYYDNAPTGVPYLALLPSCDGDVRTLEGAQMVDRGAAALDGELRGHVLFVGANHNFFNSEWRFDENELGPPVCADADRLTAPSHRAGLEDLLSSWLRFTVRGGEVPAHFRAEVRSPASLDAWAGAPLDLRFAYFSASRLVVDDFSASGTNLGGAETYAGFTAATACTGTCAGNFAHVASGARLAWDGAAASASFVLGRADALPFTAVSVRFASRTATINAGIDEHDFTIRVTDGAGTSASVLVSEVGRLGGTPPGFDAREVLGTVRVPFTRLREAAPGFDPAVIDRIEAVMPVGTNPRGSVWIADVELAAD